MKPSLVVVVSIFVSSYSASVAGQGYKLNALEDNAREQAKLSRQAPNPAVMTGLSLLRGGNGGNNAPSPGAMAPGTNMFMQAHQAWMPKVPKRDASGLPENLGAESLTGKNFLTMADNMQGGSGLQTPNGNQMMQPSAPNDPSKMKFPLRL